MVSHTVDWKRGVKIVNIENGFRMDILNGYGI